MKNEVVKSSQERKFYASYGIGDIIYIGKVLDSKFITPLDEKQLAYIMGVSYKINDSDCRILKVSEFLQSIKDIEYVQRPVNNGDN